MDKESEAQASPERPQVSAAAWAVLGAASRDKADAFLDQQAALAAKQEALTELQIKELHQELELRHWSLRFASVSALLKASFEMALAAVITGIAIVLGAAVWDAAHDHALVIEAFSVPPDLAARGLTGQAVAAQLLDRLQVMQDATDSARPADSFANNWGDDIKVEIPETGVSIGELHRLLVNWLGHETHISGEVWHTADGLAITARAGGDGATVTGKDTDFPSLIQQAAERIYERTQPYRYAAYIENDGYYLAGDGAQRLARGRVILQRLAAGGGSLRERAWAVLGLAVNALYSADVPGSLVYGRQAAAMLPDFALAWLDVAGSEGALEHEEASLAAKRVALRLLTGPHVDMSPAAVAVTTPGTRAGIDGATGDFRAALAENQAVAQLPNYSIFVENSHEAIAIGLGLLHDGHAARAAWQAMPSTSDTSTLDQRADTKPQLDAAAGDWQAVLADRAAAEAALRRTFFRNQIPQLIWPYVAEAMARTGDVAGADALIARTPLDCDACVVTRGDIAALAHDWKDADRWFALVSARTPSIPFADTQWGYALTQKGDLGGAIAHFTEAHKRGPHFADPLVMWGEALIAENRSDLALVRFAQAARYAPAWGRLHLKWGEALHWLGRNSEAHQQFAIAARLDLTNAERQSLSRWAHV